MKIKTRGALLAAWVLATSSVIVIGSIQPAGATSPGARFHAVTPERILDTRTGLGAPGDAAGPIGPDVSITLKVAGRGGVPNTGATAVVLNLTAVDPTVGGWLRLTPTGETPATVSNVNFVGNEIRPNLATVKLGTGGSIDVYNNLGATQVLADVVGWYDNGTGPVGGRYNSVAPNRDLDTRNGIGRAGTAPVDPGSSFNLAVLNLNGVPATNVSAVVLNVTVTQPTSKGFVTVFPTGVSRPTTSNLNFTAGETIANLVTVGVGTGGQITFYNDTGQTHILADIVGWYDANGTQGSFFHSVTPGRVLDSRPGKVGLYHDTPGATTIIGQPPIPPTGVTAVVANFTATDATYPGYLTIWPDGTARPNTSTVNFPSGLAAANLAIVSANSTGDIALYAFMAPTTPPAYVNLLMDAFGYFSPT